MNKHVRPNHVYTEDKKCNFSAFQSDIIIKMYEQKLSQYPDSAIGFKPKTINICEHILNLLAE